MVYLIKSFCGGSRGALIGRPCQGLFSKSAPPAAGGKKFLLILYFIANFAGHVFVVDGFFHVYGVTDTGKIGTDRIR